MRQQASTEGTGPALRPGFVDIGFVVTPGMLSTGTALPYEMWLAAGDFGRAHRRGGRRPRLHLVAAGDPRGCGRLPLTPDCTLADCPPLDLVYLPALWRNPDQVERQLPGLAPWLRQRHAAGTRLAAVSTGVSLLAASGLLDGRPATTHWYNFARFAARFPTVELKRDYFITQSGALYCAASINSLADVTVHLIEHFCDRSTAHHVERNFSHEIRRSYDDYRYLDGGAAPSPDELVVEAELWIRDNLAARASIADLARRVGVGVRTLERRFRAARGIGPRGFWQRARMQLAKELLEQTNLPVNDIAWRVGYQDAGYFTRLFRREMLVSPSDYRQTVRAKLFRPVASVNNLDKA
ncbi:MAG: helix-turn-helix domain-containing protein [Gammaproteobacteria bacterium]|nr:helix-turn-helix domain-containing protein [Gammaproteobacteria bacterium]